MPQFNSSRSTSAGKVTHWEKSSRGITGETERSNFCIQFYSDTIVRVTLTKADSIEDFSYSIVATPANTKWNLEEKDVELVLTSDKLKVILRTDEFLITFINNNGDVLNEDDNLGTCWNGDQVTTYKKLQSGERFIGLGEKTGPLDRRGQGYQHWNTDSYAYHSGSDPLYSSTPFYMGIHNKVSYGIYFDNTFKSFFNFGASNDRFSSFSADCGEMNYYFIHGETIPEIIQNYTHLTGRMPIPPKWSIGYQQCRYSYFPDTEVISIANTFREKDIPADVIVLDIHYMDAYKIFTWHKKDFSNPKKLIEDLNEKGFEVVVMCDPGIKVEAGYSVYEDGVKNDVFIKYPDGSYYTGQVWPGWCHFPDFTNPKTREWWKEKFKEYVSLGIQGFWNDMNEIATWGNQLPENLEMDFEGNKDSMRRGRNIYGFQMARATYEGTRTLLKNKRPFNLTRSAFSGIQRYAAVWTGDNVANDEHMMLGVRLLNSMGLTGIPFCGYDAGGFVGDANPKLFARWISLAAFSPFFRGHSMVNSRDSEPWSFGEEVEEISRNYIKLRYHLMPYLYSLFYEASKTGMPINRSMAIQYPHDEKVYYGTYQHQYFFGPAILVAPVESYKDFVKVYLPTGTWYGLFDDHTFTHGELIIESPVEKLPVFVKGGAILVMDQDQASNTKQKSSVLEVHVYYSSEGGAFKLYQDDGDSFAYENEEYSTQEFLFEPQAHAIKIEKTQGKFKSQYTSYKVFLHGFKQLDTVTVNGKNAKTISTDYRFLQPLRSFDPVVLTNEGYRISALQYLEISNTGETITINW